MNSSISLTLLEPPLEPESGFSENSAKTYCPFSSTWKASAEKPFRGRQRRCNPDRDDNGRPIYDVPAYVLRRNAASRWLNYDGLTHDEIDIMLGHKEKDKRPEVYLMDEADQREIAVKLERYVYNPECTRNPAFCPIEVTAGSKIDLDAYPVQRIVNTGDVPLRVHVDVIACCPDEEIKVQVPSGSTGKPTCRCEKLKLKSRIVINDNLSTFKKKENQA